MDWTDIFFSSTLLSETQVQPLGWEDPLEKGMHPTPVFLIAESHELRNLVGYSPKHCKESDMTEATEHTPYDQCLKLYCFSKVSFVTQY